MSEVVEAFSEFLKAKKRFEALGGMHGLSDAVEGNLEEAAVSKKEPSASPLFGTRTPTATNPLPENVHSKSREHKIITAYRSKLEDELNELSVQGWRMDSFAFSPVNKHLLVAVVSR